MVLLAGVWCCTEDEAASLFIGVALTGLGRGSELFLTCVEVRLPKEGSTVLVIMLDLRVELGSLLPLLGTRPLTLPMLVFREELSFPTWEGTDKHHVSCMTVLVAGSNRSSVSLGVWSLNTEYSLSS